jgi:cell division transport system permease protein
MAQFGKAASKRGKPSYFMSILGVTLVLFLLGIVGWITINSQKLIQYFKESVEVQVFLKQNLQDSSVQNLQAYINAQPYTKGLKYTDKETAKKEWMKTGGEDFTEFLDNSLLPTSIDFTLKADFVDSSRLTAIKADLSRFPIVDEVKYPTAVVGKMQRNFNLISLVLAGVAILIAVLVIVLIDNTIRLAMFSNRFLIKTMQMVGATRWFHCQATQHQGHCKWRHQCPHCHCPGIRCNYCGRALFARPESPARHFAAGPLIFKPDHYWHHHHFVQHPSQRGKIPADETGRVVLTNVFLLKAGSFSIRLCCTQYYRLL